MGFCSPSQGDESCFSYVKVSSGVNTAGSIRRGREALLRVFAFPGTVTANLLAFPFVG